MYSSNERMAQRRTTVDFSRTGWQQFSKLNRKLGKRFLQAFVLRRELAEFREQYPKVDLTQELLDKLMGDVAAGKSLTDAYRSYEASQKDERIAELERQLAAEKQNKENRTSSPGSQKDSGGRRTKDDFDDFKKALFG